MTRFTAMLVVATLGLVIVGYGQQCQLEKSVLIQSEQQRLTKLSIDTQRAWVFAGCGGAGLVNGVKGKIITRPDYKNYGASPAFVEHVFLEICPKSKLPPNPKYNS